MTRLQQQVIDQLFLGGYLFVRDRKTNAQGKDFRRYTMYTGNKNPIRIYYERSLKRVLMLCKKDAKGRYTLNLSLVRQQRKNSYVKQLYLELQKQTTRQQLSG